MQIVKYFDSTPPHLIITTKIHNIVKSSSNSLSQPLFWGDKVIVSQ